MSGPRQQRSVRGRTLLQAAAEYEAKVRKALA
jgi:hypothetical protein